MGPQTPYLLLDEAALNRNITAMAQAVARRGCSLRPHIKTHKMVEIARKQLAAGAVGITVAKLGEAQVMADAGIDDIFMAYPVVGGDKIARAVALSRQARRLILSVDSWEGAQALSAGAQAAGVQLEVRLEVDTGYERTGVPYDQAAALAARVAALPGLNLTGIYTFRGSILDGRPTADRDAAGSQEGRMMAALARELAPLGVREVSGGSTPTALAVAAAPGMTEVRPGTYVFNDRMQVSLGVCRPGDCALRVVYTVVSVPRPGRLVLDGGSKAISADVPPGAPPYNLEGYGACPEDPALRLVRLTEEHGMATFDPATHDYHVGDTVALVPNHVCTTVNLYDEVWLPDGRCWPVAARGKSS